MNQNLFHFGLDHFQTIAFAETFELEEKFDLTLVETLAFELLGSFFESSESISLKSIGCFVQNNSQETEKMTPDSVVQSYRVLPLRAEYCDRVAPAAQLQPKLKLSYFLDLCEAQAEPVCPRTGEQQRPYIFVTPYLFSEQALESRDSQSFGAAVEAMPKVFLYSVRVDLIWLEQSCLELKLEAILDGSALGKDRGAGAQSANKVDKIWLRLRAVLHAWTQTKNKPARTCNSGAQLACGVDEVIGSGHRDQLRKGIETLKKNMYLGNCYLANMCTLVSLPHSILARDVGHFLMRYFKSPPRFGWYLPGRSLSIECYSPERFIRIWGDQIVTEPIKGTIACGQDEGSRQLAAQKLWASVKERAEQHLVVDLLRNDLAKVCRPGSVQLDSLFEIRFDSGLGQMSSVISGVIDSKFSFRKLLECVLPAGSVTGSPKTKVIQILENLETLQRRFYCGVCFDVRKNDDVEGTLLIRSLFQESMAHGGSSVLCTYAGAGAGITALSDVEKEIAEIEAKLMSFLRRCRE